MITKEKIMRKLLLIAFVILGIANAQAQDIKLGKWELGETTDEFGDPTGAKFIYYFSIEAEFSNSATTGSELMVMFRVEADGTIVLLLAEYNNNIVKAYSDTKYLVKIKDENGELHQTTLRMREGSQYIFDDGVIYELLRTKQKLKFYIKEVTDGYPATYKFGVNTENFNQLLDSIQ